MIGFTARGKAYKREPRLAETGVPLGRLSALADGDASLSVRIVLPRLRLEEADGGESSSASLRLSKHRMTIDSHGPF